MLLLFVVASLLVASEARILRQQEPVKNSYIVVLHQGVNDTASAVNAARSYGDLTVKKVWAFSTFRGFVVNVASPKAEASLLQLERHVDVDYIEENGVVRTSQQCNIQRDATWGIDRVNHDKPDLDGDFIYQHEGEGVTAYVIDTGIRLDHVEFRPAGRAIWGVNTIDGTTTDGNGHGTHVAGTIGGVTYGIAKKVTLVAVKVLNNQGSGTWQSVIDGMEWVVGYNSGGNRKGVINMSLGGGKTQSVNDAADACSRAGILTVVAAGNNNGDACNTSPASAPTALTVGSTVLTPVDNPDAPGEDEGQEDTRSSFSNYGSCVKVFGPGTLVTSAWHTSASAIHTISGTSMASPHVAGVGANLWSQDLSLNSAQLQTKMSSVAQDGLINLQCTNAACRNSPNKFIHLPMCQ